MKCGFDIFFEFLKAIFKNRKYWKVLSSNDNNYTFFTASRKYKILLKVIKKDSKLSIRSGFDTNRLENNKDINYFICTGSYGKWTLGPGNGYL